ncbi:conserved hypothetical protein [Histoplasma capsulatum var. duboisii H88]|uniref:Uncharacterized protein n=2 Tax=Ajellomyces capsulatus TaxID=5037 RepID=F0UAD1_AJEC8|nr:conserved hypothetical protein [Histoplasma capsulatum H143]EGC42850.1 conserved hypothetical protein [Histoplasma capsulatum var. duboisii H88]
MPPATDASVPSKPNARVAKNVLCIGNVQLVNVPVSVPSQRIINISRKLVRVAKEPQIHALAKGPLMQRASAMRRTSPQVQAYENLRGQEERENVGTLTPQRDVVEHNKAFAKHNPLNNLRFEVTLNILHAQLRPKYCQD